MSDAGARAARVRRTAGWFELRDRALLYVTGADRARWTNGMLSNEVAALAPGPERSGCWALLLTPQGRIVADIHVLCRDDELWLELDAAVAADARQRLERYVIADDVTIAPAGDTWRRFALEGPSAPGILARALGAELGLAPESGVETAIAGAPAVAWAWGWSGAPAFQLFVAPGAADDVAAAVAAAAGGELVQGDDAVLEVLRVEAGRPRLGRELGEDVLPAETGLVGRAVSLSKGCYTGQEIVARMDARDAASHRLVGFRFEGELAAAGASVQVAGERVGELTSACLSELAGAIGLGYVRRAHATPDTAVSIEGRRARVAPLPFVSGPS